MKSVLIIGATSDVAKATAEKYASQGVDLVLMGRKASDLKQLAENYKIRHGVNVSIVELDLTFIETHEGKLKEMKELPEITIVFAGYLGDQKKAQEDGYECNRIIESNYTGIVSICNLISNKYEKSGNGTIAVLSSVAGERGRQSNYIYGSAKAGLTAYLSGLRNRLQKSNVHVLTVLPGFMDTKMTEGMGLPKFLTAKPNLVAEKIQQAIRKKKNVIYVKWMWRYIMLIIRNVPEAIFKKLNL